MEFYYYVEKYIGEYKVFVGLGRAGMEIYFFYFLGIQVIYRKIVFVFLIEILVRDLIGFCVEEIDD